MRIWCCFGFDEDDEERVRFGLGGMKDDIFSSEGDGNSEDMENDESESLQLGLGFGRRPSHEEEAEKEEEEEEEEDIFLGEINFGEREKVGDDLFPCGPMTGIGNYGWFDGSASTSGNGSRDVDELEADEEALKRDNCLRDTHHKRPKVHSYSREYNFATAMTSDAGNSRLSINGDLNAFRGSLVPYRSEDAFVSSIFHHGGDEGPANSIHENYEGHGSDSMSIEDSEIRMDLTDDLLHMVFSFLDHINLCRAAIVCRQWRAASAHEDFWRCLNFENRNISVEQFEDICRRYPNATEVNILGAPSIHLLLTEAVSSLRNLEALTVGKGQLGDSFFHALVDCHMLRSLIVNEATLGNGIQEIPINHDRLRHLQITKCRVLRISVRCPQLETLSLKRSNMAHAVLNCPLLRDLDIGSCHKLSDAGIHLAATSCPLLESLDMSNCSCVSDETLRDIAHACGYLRVLNASYCPNISLESVRLPMLTVLRLDNCEGITSASMAAISLSNMLEVLELDNCSLLTYVSLDLPRLRDIRLVHCRKFVDLKLCTMMLSSITVSNCAALRWISITSNSLQVCHCSLDVRVDLSGNILFKELLYVMQKLVLQKQESLTTLSLQCQCLQEVDLTDCESLMNSICKVFSDGGGCPMLRSLVLDNCESLTDVRFCSNSLVSLSLVGCRAIIALQLLCPRLEQVHLDGCDHLEKASFCPVGLQSLNLGICPKLDVLSIEAPRMEVLELKGCGGLSEASINCPLLTSLDASFCSRLKDDCLAATAASCPRIESLILMSCPSVGLDGLLSLCWLRNLTLLDLSYTFLMNLQPVFKSCLQLKVLKLQACKYLTNSSLEPLYKEGALPALCELDLSYGTLCQSAIEELLACCTHLTHLSLNGCANMHDLNWGFGATQLLDVTVPRDSSGLFSHKGVHDPIELPNRLLQNLNCVGCPNIKKVFIPPTARCFHLSSLNLSLSANLKEVDVSCYNPCILNFSNCCSLEILKLDCPRLTSLFLQSCSIDVDSIAAAISECNMLETLDVRFCPKICSASLGLLRAVCPSLKRIFSGLSPS
ncbi:F-box domain [Dillenia turbinata]|uniref:F-box domain n=1 Tax=Dillenia turbinata TaxID=194707 RepID=A0AAN8UJE3_9MAGN